MKTSRRAVAIVVFTLAGLAFLAVALFRRSQPIEIEAKQLAYAMWEGDIETIYNHSMESERRLTGLRRDSLRALWTELILPRYRGSKILGFMTQRNSSQGICQLTLSHPKNIRERFFSAMLVETDNGRKTLITVHLAAAWVFEYKTDPAEDAVHALLQGIEDDKAYLKQLGIKGLYSVDYTTGEDVFSTWDEYEARLKAKIAAEERGEQYFPDGSE